MRIVVQEAPFDYGAECDGFATGRTDVGAVVTFAGLVRSDADLDRMEIEHYPGMTESALTAIAEEAARRWSLQDVLVIHRVGPMRPGERIMMVATAAPHRRDAFEAADYLMDYLKSRAPFWKKEHGPQGESWVEAKATDEDALSRW
ncbi:molybdopterin converting factor subunit 2 [Roseivivax marinus]|uniref:Molybdopterin synthase catalytic subunit n=1 Tax=Roseivivax marinus TaxID=1379903 RepID=W4HID8_9RHOB|nr:molybdenum cofactor biosynthesis protein MoaE [Roseivivax marinus]ETW12178.1 molybdopterin converting factor subunit 2 [Roseivivax marinus]UMA64798.1 molybdenum cofactor biosynthesis protein MoaE [Roseivivax marinus]